jgi:hypothetical protein
MEVLMTNALKDSIDKTKLQNLLQRFRSAVRRGIDRGLADEIEYQIIQCGHAILEIATTKKLARWCNTNGSPYQDAMPVAREISEVLFGVVLDRRLLNT